MVVKAELVAAVENETVPHVRNKVCDTVSTLAAVLCEEAGGGWPELFPKLFEWATASPAARMASMKVFGPLRRCVAPHFDKVVQALLPNLAPEQTAEVREAALTAAASFVMVLTDKRERDLFAPVLLPMLQCIGDFLTAGDETAARNGIELFLEVIEHDQLAFFKPEILRFLQAMTQIARTETLDEDTQFLAFEFVVMTAEIKPGMVRKKMPQLVEVAFQIALTWMLQIDEAEQWGATALLSEDKDHYSEGLEAMDRLSIAIGGKTLLPFAFAPSQIPGYLQDQRWQARHAALMVISQISEGSQKQIMQQLGEIVNMVIKYFQDPHPRVRYAAINCIGQIATDFSPELQQNYHAVGLPALVQAMGDSSSAQVQGHAASCVINFAEGMETSVMQEYAQPIVEKLLQLVQVNDQYVVEQSLTAIAAMADCLGETFAVFYDKIMPGLKQMFSQMPSETKEQQSLRCRAMECITVIGVAVGKERFGADAVQLMEMIHACQKAITKDDDSQTSAIQHAYSRICKVLGTDFMPYLQHVMPSVIQTAQQNEVDVDSDDESGIAADDEDDDMVNISTSILEEKATACEMICCYLEVLGEGFAPYVEECTELLVPFLNHYAEVIRTAANTAMPLLLDSAKKALETQQQDSSSFVHNFLVKCLEGMLEAINSSSGDDELDMLRYELQALGELFQAAGTNCLDDTQQAMVVRELDGVLKNAINQRKLRAEHNTEQADDLDEEELEAQQEQLRAEGDVLMMYMQCLCELIKVQRQRVLPLLKSAVDIFVEMLKPSYSPQDRKLAALVLDDVIEYGGPDTCAPLLPQIMPLFIQYLDDPDIGVRQAVAYGVGQMAQNGGEIVGPHVRSILTVLERRINAPGSRDNGGKDGGAVHATDNYISAFGAFIQCRGTEIGDLAPVMAMWVNWLPVTGDLEEGKTIYNRLCLFCEQDATLVLGPTGERLGRVVCALTDALGTEATDAALTQRIARLLHGLNSQMGPQMQAAVNALNPNQTAKLQELLSSPQKPELS